MGLYTTFKKFILSSVDRHKLPQNVNLEAIILKCHKTGKKTSEGEEVKLLLHVSPSVGRSYLHEYIDVHQASEITHYLQPGQLVYIDTGSIKGKAILRWKE